MNRSGKMRTIKIMKKLTEEATILEFQKNFFQKIGSFIGRANRVPSQYEAQ